ncbi:aldo/keto reductase, partial [Thioclava sp. BHET1]
AEQIGGLNRVREAGLVRHIGISNYATAQMREAARLSPAPLVTNQIEYHPWLSQRPVIDCAQALGMAVTGYYAMADGRAARDPLLTEIGARHGKSAAQVALRWQVQQPGLVALSKTATLARLPENFAIFDFALSTEEMAAIHALAQPEGTEVRLVRG